MDAVINIVVTCTKRKSRLAPPDLQLRTISSKSLGQKHRVWLRRLRNASGSAMPVSNLYAGDHWSVVRSLSDAASKAGFEAKVWVSSAGYGLVPLHAKVHPYTATFAPGLPDSVAHGIRGASAGQVAKEWWRLLTKWSGPTPRAPRSIAVLARRHPNCPLIIVASPSYMNAIEEDVASAAQIVGGTGNLMIFSRAPNKDSRIAPYYLPCSAVLQRVVGGARTSLNVRILRSVLERAHPGKLNHASVRHVLQRLIRKHPQRRSPARRSASDAEVRRYIAQHLEANGAGRFGPLLRKFRDEGNACEYSRFRALFQGVQRQGSHGT